MMYMRWPSKKDKTMPTIVCQEFVKKIQKGRICGKFRQMKSLCMISTKVDT